MTFTSRHKFTLSSKICRVAPKPRSGTVARRVRGSLQISEFASARLTRKLDYGR